MNRPALSEAYNSDFFDGRLTYGHMLRECGRDVIIHQSAILPAKNLSRISIGRNVRIDAGAILSAHEILIGDFVHIGAYTILSGPGKIVFEDFSAMSHGAKIFTATDDLSKPALCNTTVPLHLQALTTGDVTIGRHAIIGVDAVIMPNVTLGHSAVAGAKSFVKDDVPPYAIVGGIPASFIKERARHITPEALAELEERCRNGK